MEPPGIRSQTSALSLEEWASLPEEVPGELVDGALAEEELPSYVHEFVIAWLLHALLGWVLPRGGFAGGSEAKFAVAAGRGRKPDLSVYFPGRRPPATARLISTPPDIVVEVVTATPADARRDRVDKLRDYARFGVRYYWLVDPELRTFEVLELGADGRYVHALAEELGVVSPPGCEGLRIDLSALWTEVDRLLAGGAGA